MIIMPSSRKMTSQSMPVSGEKNASSAEAITEGQDDPGPGQRRRHLRDPLGGDQDVGGDEDRDRDDAVTGPPRTARRTRVSDAAEPAPAAGTR